jgi:hypothetical protein
LVTVPTVTPATVGPGPFGVGGDDDTVVEDLDQTSAGREVSIYSASVFYFLPERYEWTRR